MEWLRMGVFVHVWKRLGVKKGIQGGPSHEEGPHLSTYMLLSDTKAK